MKKGFIRSHFNKLFPFAFTTDENGQIRGVGPSLKKLLPEMRAGTSLFDSFDFVRPEIVNFQKETEKLFDELVVIKCKSRDFKLMGQVLYSKEIRRYTFVLNLAVNEIDNIAQLGLDFNDFPIQDQTFDFLMLLQTQRMVLKEAEALNQKWKAAHESAIKASEMKSQFLANMSHELRTPMNGVLGMASILLETELTADQRDYVETIVKSGEGMLSLVNDILDLSKIESGHIELESAPFDLRVLIDDVTRVLMPTAKNKELILESFIDDRIQRKVFGDRDRVRQVMLNFLSNAVKFTSHGSVSIVAKVLDQAKDEMKIEFVVRDTGIGMDAETLQRIFQPFVQGDSSMSKQYGGTGLGLSISKKLIRAMRGDVTVRSELGRGSEFIFQIPFKLQD